MSALRKAPAALAFLLGVACQDAPLSAPLSPSVPLPNPGVYTGWILTPRGEPIEVTYEVIGGLSILEGDITLGPAGTVAKTREELLAGRVGRQGPQRGSVIDGPSNYTWRYGFVPYVIGAGFDNTQQQVILNAMAHIASTTGGTRFTARTTEQDYVRFALSTACHSDIGRQGGGQTIELTAACANDRGSVAHEILHSLGMWHEQSRCDRDTFVAIHPENIQFGKHHNFVKKCPSSGAFWDVGGIDVLSYSEGSVMHYPPDAFSNNGQPTITSLRGLDGLMGHHSGLNQTDASTINIIYQPFPPQGVAVTYPSGTPTISWNAYSYNHGATSVSVNLLRTYDEWNDYAGTHNSWDENLYGVGSTTGLSLQDTQSTYTGDSRCVLSSDINGSTSYTYYYEVWATFPDGVVSQTVRWPADVAPSYPCSLQ